MNLKFRYVNHNGEDHEYVIVPETKLTFDRHGEEDEAWHLSGRLITRDGDPRPNIGNRRRSFILTKMRDIEEVPA